MPGTTPRSDNPVLAQRSVRLMVGADGPPDAKRMLVDRGVGGTRATWASAWDTRDLGQTRSGDRVPARPRSSRGRRRRRSDEENDLERASAKAFGLALLCATGAASYLAW